MASALMMPRRTRSQLKRSNPASSSTCGERVTATGFDGVLPEAGVAGSLRLTAPDLAAIAMTQASDQDAEDDMQDAEPQAEHQRMRRRGQHERDRPQGDEQRAHDADEPCDPGSRHRARRENRTAVEKQPGARNEAQRAGVRKRQREHRAGKQRGTKTKQEFSGRSQITRVPA